MPIGTYSQLGAVHASGARAIRSRSACNARASVNQSINQSINHMHTHASPSQRIPRPPRLEAENHVQHTTTNQSAQQPTNRLQGSNGSQQRAPPRVGGWGLFTPSARALVRQWIRRGFGRRWVRRSTAIQRVPVDETAIWRLLGEASVSAFMRFRCEALMPNVRSLTLGIVPQSISYSDSTHSVSRVRV